MIHCTPAIISIQFISPFLIITPPPPPPRSQLSNVDASYALGIDNVPGSSSSSSSSHSQSHRTNTLALYVSVCRLLDLCLVLTSEELPQFQLLV